MKKKKIDNEQYIDLIYECVVDDEREPNYYRWKGPGFRLFHKLTRDK